MFGSRQGCFSLTEYEGSQKLAQKGYHEAAIPTYLKHNKNEINKIVQYRKTFHNRVKLLNDKQICSVLKTKSQN